MIWSLGYQMKNDYLVNLDSRESDYPLTEAQIKEFFKKLNRRADRCGATFRHSREILQRMDISRADQIKFINICKEYGGYNDIEILMNAQKEIYDDFGIEIP